MVMANRIEPDDRRRTYPASAGQTEFPVPFPFQRNEDLQFSLLVLGMFVPLIYPTDYTVTGAGTETGGIITLLAPAAAGDEFELLGSAALDRQTSIAAAGKFGSKLIDSEFDRRVIIEQETRRDLDDARSRVLMVPRGEVLAKVLPAQAARADRVLLFDADGEAAPGPTVPDIENAQANAAAAAASATAAATSEANSATSELNAANSATATAADAVSTAADAALTDSDRIAAEAAKVAAQTAETGAIANADAASGSAATASAKAVLTAADAVATAADKVATNADAAQTAINATATAADAVQTNLDRIAAAQSAVDAANAAVGDAANINFTPAGGIAATKVQAALEELDTEKAPVSHTHTTANVTGLDTALAAKAATATLVSAGTGLTGGGSLASNRTISASIATLAEAQAGTLATKLMTPQRTAQAIAALSPTGPDYESPEQVITTSGALTLAHGLGVAPTMLQVFLKCLVAEQGYSVGDVLIIGTAADASTTTGVNIVPDATNIFCRYGNAAQSFYVGNKTNGATVGLTNTSWKMIVRVWK